MKTLKLVDLKPTIPGLYITLPIDEETFKMVINDKTPLEVIKRLYLLKNNFKKEYYFMESSLKDYHIEAKIIPNFIFTGKALSQIKKSKKLKEFLLLKAKYKIKVNIYDYTHVNELASFEYDTKFKNDIYKYVIDLKKYLQKNNKELWSLE